ncbi:ferrochelatase [Litorimonas taeanensis]|uniref:Ferrochelatase n=1 Tax=Litorimonas taeanensis TaxID=568099 RepID=A0A420WK56_9PROT|nr:ferrochelatase [Litorimonas taeanensis]RKQ71397.1 ferrochelatase [Litorimonas taeanensis]
MSSKIGLLLVNLGSPDAPTPAATRRYLAEFLHDRRVIDTSRWIWCPILHGIILRTRPAKSAKAYEKVWNEPEFSNQAVPVKLAPLVRITGAQAQALQEAFGEDVQVEYAMRYGNPSIEAALDALMEKGCMRVGVLPLYPQFAGATTASVFDGISKAIKARMDLPEIRFLRHYYDEPQYIKALSDSLTDHFATLDWKPEAIMASYHGLPQSYVDKGDPYQAECLRTTELLRQEMNVSEDYLFTTFQSRFGPKAWLQPYTDKTLEQMPKKGVKKIAVVMPGFSADCLETLEEIKLEASETFLANGGEKFTAVPCLNTRPDHLNFLKALSEQRLLNGWL